MPYPNNTGWAPLRDMRVKGFRPDYQEALEPGIKVAGHLKKLGIGPHSAINMSDLGKRSLMQNAGLQLNDVDSYGDDIWEHAIHVLRQNH